MWTRRDFLEVLGTAGALAVTHGCTPSGRNPSPVGGGAVDRLAVLERHAPRIRRADPAAVLSVGNGNFAFNVDCTGLQTLHEEYKVIPLATLSHWGWHTVPSKEGIDWAHFRYRQWPFYGRDVPYATDSTGQRELFDYLRANPHRLNLARIAFILDGRPITTAQITDIDQQLDLSTGLVTSRFLLGGAKVSVVTCCHGTRDVVGLRIISRLLVPGAPEGRLEVQLSFPYGSTASSGDGGDWGKPGAHTTELQGNPRTGYRLERTLDATRYAVCVIPRTADVSIRTPGPHVFVLTAKNTGLDLAIGFERSERESTADRDPQTDGGAAYSIEALFRSSAAAWQRYWTSGAAIDLGNCTDPRAPELERRVVLSQYLTAIHCAGTLPSQETGLLCNSWYGKFHLEMHWWHSVHFTVWNRFEHFARSLTVYERFLESSRARARQQGFAGARWPKMTGPDGDDSPSPVGPMLIWQQPHPIYYAELCYRADPRPETLRRWRDIVVATADFMASFAQYVESRGQYVLGPAIKTVSENNPTDRTLNPAWELTAWRMGLRLAQTWLRRLGEPPNTLWNKVARNLAPAPVADGLYQMEEGMATFTREWAWEHPGLLGAYGVLPGDGIDPAIMALTVRKVRETWNFSRVWGWDFPLAALAAARTGQPELAIDFLTMDAPMNRYLANGCNFQRDNVPVYFPGNGGLLAAVGMMAGGWTESRGPTPGFPKNGKWNVQAERFGWWM